MQCGNDSSLFWWVHHTSPTNKYWWLPTLFLQFTVDVEIVTKPNSIHMLWLLPQIFMITVAEVMINIPVMNISFSQAPKSLKSLVMSFNMIMMALGNIIDVLVIATLKGVFSNRVTNQKLFLLKKNNNILAWIVITFHFRLMSLFCSLDFSLWTWSFLYTWCEVSIMEIKWLKMIKNITMRWWIISHFPSYSFTYS